MAPLAKCALQLHCLSSTGRIACRKGKHNMNAPKSICGSCDDANDVKHSGQAKAPAVPMQHRLGDSFNSNHLERLQIRNVMNYLA